MTNNEIDATISKMRGECRHPHTQEYMLEGIRMIGCVVMDCSVRWLADNENPAPLYASDPAAWPPELFKEIEKEKGYAPLGLTLKQVFAGNLHKILGEPRLEYGESCGHPTISPERLFEVIKATPLQKATALARAIKESE